MINWQALRNGLLDTLFPPLCLSCEKRLPNSKIHLCLGCEFSVELHTSFFCPECNRRLPPALVSKAYPPCHPKTNFILAAATSYGNSVVNELIHLLKYKSAKTAAVPLAKILGTYLTHLTPNSYFLVPNSLLVPIPLHPRKKRKRGFNQATLIAETLRQLWEIQPPIEVELPYIEKDVLVKIKHTPSQTEMKNFEARTKNIAGSFETRNQELIRGKNIILIDDVFTSGATMKEAVGILKAAGAQRIIGLVVAKA